MYSMRILSFSVKYKNSLTLFSLVIVGTYTCLNSFTNSSQIGHPPLYLISKKVFHQASASFINIYISKLTFNLSGISMILKPFSISCNYSSTLSGPFVPLKFGGLVLINTLCYATVEVVSISSTIIGGSGGGYSTCCPISPGP